MNLCLTVCLYDLHVIIIWSEYDTYQLDLIMMCVAHVKNQLFDCFGRLWQQCYWIVSNECAWLRKFMCDSVLYELHLIIIRSEYDTYQLDLIMMCVAVNDFSKISYSTVSGGNDNIAYGE